MKLTVGPMLERIGNSMDFIVKSEMEFTIVYVLLLLIFLVLPIFIYKTFTR